MPEAMQQGYFITGTDTNAGKTWATLALMQAFKRQGKTVVGMKPVASGCRLIDGQLKNDDALLLQAHASLPLAYDVVNPYAYEQPISPHLAGMDDPVEIAVLSQYFRELQTLADVILVEGAGGWFTPINAEQDISDLARALGLPVILAVAIKLGCINHAKLTARAIASTGLKLAGSIAVCNDPAMLRVEDNIAAVQTALPAPLLGIIPFQARADLTALHRFLELGVKNALECGI